MNHTEIIKPYTIEAGWLITARSYFTDRVVPACEHIRMPAKSVPGCTLRWGRGDFAQTQPNAPTGKKRLAGLLKKHQPLHLETVNTFDLRRNNPSNWAHFLNDHLPLVFTTCARLSLSPDEALLILPENTPDYIRGATEVFGLKMLATDAPLEGEGILYEPDPWDGIRPERTKWAQTDFTKAALARLEAAGGPPLPQRVFLSRRDTRAPLNEDEVMAQLAPLGFEKIYPEDLTPADQIRLFREAEIVVAVHGAGLAPLMYSHPGGRLRLVLEILHAGHMTDNFRVMAQQVGVDWIGVRGRLKPKYVSAAYDFSAPIYRKHSLDNFEVDPIALKEAFKIAGVA